MKCFCVLFFFVFFFTDAKAQHSKPQDFYARVKNYDCSRLWCADSVVNLSVVDNTITGEPKKFSFPRPLGFIGDSLQRLYIHYTSVAKDVKNPYLYHVVGKTRVKDNVCSFSGTIMVQKAMMEIVGKLPQSVLSRGKLICTCTFFEDSSNRNRGIIAGKLESDFCLYQGILAYDNIEGVADGYYNNQFVGTWKSYKNGMVKACNWGDNRIPGSKRLDIGAGEFSPADEYLKFGWQNYSDAYSGANSKKRKCALAEENREWWE